MSELMPPSGRVHWIGTGMSTGSGLGLVCAGAETVLWGRTVAKAEACLDRLELGGRAQTRAFTLGSLAAELRRGDVVVSMLPASEHPSLVELALERDAHFVCSSYLSSGIAAHANEAAERGLVILTEIGLDPGIDHLLAHKLVTKAMQVTGDRPATVRFTSYCGSNPAVANDFRYRFSWAPRGVLTALLTPARLIEGGVVREVARPWEVARSQTVLGESFEVYPNRDSVPFVRTYAFPESWAVEDFVRGTLRLEGWSDAWKPVFADLVDADDAEITELAEDLAERHPTTADDHDRVVMSVKLQVRTADGDEWAGEYVLDSVGDAVEAATPRLVSAPLAGGILSVVASSVPAGLHQASSDLGQVQDWLEFLAGQGITVSFQPR
ncbi:saccharopine dehydrogenase family protein [Myceligenerans crystallogenes]|uniref:Saccharopine dehydrogenase n=1 Tax=Myceligenerans crystallogenes TaxID=316335 RepID=A0ABN2NJS1_9MICO